MSQPMGLLLPSSSRDPHFPHSNILVSGKRDQQPAASARYWTSLGRHIYSTSGAPLRVVNPYSTDPVVLQYLLYSQPPLSIAQWPNVHSRQIQQVNYWANRPDTNFNPCWGLSENPQHATGGHITIGIIDPRTLLVAPPQPCIHYRLQGQQFTHHNLES